jgi:hypothetical protein
MQDIESMSDAEQSINLTSIESFEEENDFEIQHSELNNSRFSNMD